MRTVVVLGGYGNFGKRIVGDLARIPDLVLVIAGRSLGKASKRCREIKTSAAQLIPYGIDIDSDEFESKLNEMSPFLVINASGPFQNQNYHIPKACINVGCHYVDLADDRRFVCDIGSLNRDAMGKKVLIVSACLYLLASAGFRFFTFNTDLGTYRKLHWVTRVFHPSLRN
jgi:saccharopine dehydrogenase-like NADP-dependent oxidoreductase